MAAPAAHKGWRAAIFLILFCNCEISMPGRPPAGAEGGGAAGGAAGILNPHELAA